MYLLYLFLNCLLLKNVHMENFFFCCNIYIYIYIYIYIAIIINISIIIYFFFYSLNLFIQACNCCFYMLMSWFLLVHTCLTNDTMYVLSNYK